MTESAPPIDLNELFRGEQARGLASLGATHTHSMSLLGYVATNKWDEIDPRQAVALKEAGKVGAGYDLNQLRPPALQPATP